MTGGGGGGGGGQIVEVEGGHIVRSTGRKDRHSKVCTAKGPRDRRVRLSAHTAIQFYDVQDRLGYDRPSKAVDWLIKKAKAAIDELAELPPWHPTAAAGGGLSPSLLPADATGKIPMHGADNHPQPYHFSASSSFVPPPPPPPALDSDAIAETFKSFFPMASPGDELPSSQDLRLSLQSFQDPGYFTGLQFEPPPPQTASVHWPERLLPWSHAPDPSPAFSAVPLLAGPAQQQRGPLQSSYSPLVRAWADPVSAAAAAGEHSHSHSLHLPPHAFPGFHIPARIHGDDKEHDDGCGSSKPSSASSASRH